MIGIIIEARVRLTRSLNKVLSKINGISMIEIIIDRLKMIPFRKKIIIATTKKKEDNILEQIAKKNKINFFRGSTNNVLQRVLFAAEKFKIKTIVEICGDCPLLDPVIITKQIKIFKNNITLDYVGSNLKKTFPIGSDAKVFSTKALSRVNKSKISKADRENVSLYIYENPKKFSLKIFKAKKKLYRPDLPLIVDYKKDIQAIEKIFQNLGKNKKYFSTMKVINYLDKNQKIKKMLQSAPRIKVAGRDENL